MTAPPGAAYFHLSGRRPRPFGLGMNATSPAGEHLVC